MRTLTRKTIKEIAVNLDNMLSGGYEDYLIEYGSGSADEVAGRIIVKTSNLDNFMIIRIMMTGGLQKVEVGESNFEMDETIEILTALTNAFNA